LLDADTKRLIDRARNTLVGKIPDPKSQIEQIAIAIIYKFMPDLGAQAAQSPNQKLLLNNGRPRDRWTELTQSHLDNAQKLEFYSHGLKKMSETAGIPAAIRKILRNAQTSCEDPGTLARFLRAIDEFQYEHLDDLADTLEYLFAQLGSQSTGGQFCTPIHIREFIVSIVDPRGSETILDPACGTAGFLVSARNHLVRASHVFCKGEISSLERDDATGQIRGYDISPDMVRLSTANLFIHGLNDPQIFEHDVLGSDEHWDSSFDVIFANPPFMSPRGGMTHHAKFPIASRRSELLFLQYIATHLTANGRAGIIVPEGILFKNRGVYKKVRRMLLENGLVAVVSLPAGCFNPYSEVKTSILFIDKGLGGSSETIGFFRADNDGFGLGKLRTRIAKNDLPQIQTEINRYFSALRHNRSVNTIRLEHGQVVPKSEIETDGDIFLPHLNRHKLHHHPTNYPGVALGDLVEFLDYNRRPIRRADRMAGPYPYYGASGIVDHIDRYLFDEPLVLVGEDGAKWGPGERTAYRVTGKFWVNNHAHILRPRRDQILDRYLEEVLNEADLTPFVAGVTVLKLNQERFKTLRIPLPPIEQQRKIVTKIEEHRKAIEQARGAIIRLEHKIRKIRIRAWNS